MKKLIAILVLSASSYAQAFQALPMNDTKGAYVAAYTLNQFNINPQSLAIPNTSNIYAGNIQINMEAKELRLTLFHRSNCPKGAMCIMMIPPPTEIVLPIVHIGSGFCGGHIIVAEQDLRPVDGGLTSLEIVDDNGNLCEPKTGVVKTVEMTLTEQAARSTQNIVSTFTGLPVR
jgi:hypothetical protein